MRIADLLRAPDAEYRLSTVHRPARLMGRTRERHVCARAQDAYLAGALEPTIHARARVRAEPEVANTARASRPEPRSHPSRSMRTAGLSSGVTMRVAVTHPLTARIGVEGRDQSSWGLNSAGRRFAVEFASVSCRFSGHCLARGIGAIIIVLVPPHPTRKCGKS